MNIIFCADFWCKSQSGDWQGPPPSALVHLLEQAMEQHQVGNEPCEHGRQSWWTECDDNDNRSCSHTLNISFLQWHVSYVLFAWQYL